MNKKLYRDEYHRVLGGVCSGLAEYFDMDPTIVRLLFAGTFFLMGIGLGTYIVLWIVLPRKGYLFTNVNNPNVDYTVPPPQQANTTFNTPPPPRADKSFGGAPYGGAPFGGKPFNPPPKQKSNAGLIFGLIMIFIGAVILNWEFDLIPELDFGTLCAIALLLAGGALIVSGQARRSHQNEEWQHTGIKDNSSNDNPPAAADTEADSTITKES
jgi:phage shock protein C